MSRHYVYLTMNRRDALCIECGVGWSGVTPDDIDYLNDDRRNCHGSPEAVRAADLALQYRMSGGFDGEG